MKLTEYSNTIKAVQSETNPDYKGDYANETAITNVYPNGIANPETRIGWNVINNETDTLWIWDVETNMWVNTSTTLDTDKQLEIWVANENELNGAVKTLNNTKLGGRIHFKNDISFTKNYVWNLKNIEVLGHGNKLYCAGKTITVTSRFFYFDKIHFFGTLSSVSQNTQKLFIINIAASETGMLSTEYKLIECRFYYMHGVCGTNYPFIEVIGNADKAIHIYFRFCWVNAPASGIIDYILIKNTGQMLNMALYVEDHATIINNYNRFKLDGTNSFDKDLFRTDGSGVIADGGLALEENTVTHISVATHNHNSSYSALGHNHNDDYSPLSHNHDSSYSGLAHTHDTRYYTESEIDTKLLAKAETAHNHDETYYTESETNALLSAKQATITGAASTVVSSNLTALRALVSDASGKITSSTITSTKLGYLSDVTSAIQTQLFAKQATITGAATTVVSSNLTVSRALVSDASGKIAVSTITDTKLGYLSDVTSAIQAQLSGKAFTTHTHTLVKYFTETWTMEAELLTTRTFIEKKFRIASGTTLKVKQIDCKIKSGTSATIKLQKNGVDLTGFTSISATTNWGNTAPASDASHTLADGDIIAPVCTAVSATPVNVSINVTFEETLTV